MFLFAAGSDTSGIDIANIVLALTVPLAAAFAAHSFASIRDKRNAGVELFGSILADAYAFADATQEDHAMRRHGTEKGNWKDEYFAGERSSQRKQMRARLFELIAKLRVSQILIGLQFGHRGKALQDCIVRLYSHERQSFNTDEKPLPAEFEIWDEYIGIVKEIEKTIETTWKTMRENEGGCSC
jgi:hypothetical protein